MRGAVSRSTYVLELHVLYIHHILIKQLRWEVETPLLTFPLYRTHERILRKDPVRTGPRLFPDYGRRSRTFIQYKRRAGWQQCL
jgi:hypothetical protein